MKNDEKRTRVLAGRKVPGFPIAVMATQHIQDLLHLPKRKEKSAKLSMETLNYDIDFPLHRIPSDTASLIRKATFASTTAPYLRAIVVCFFSLNRVQVKLIQPIENRLFRAEFVALLGEVYKLLKYSTHVDELYFPEYNSTHMIEGSNFADMLLTSLEYTDKHSPEVLFLSVYHDYVRIRQNLSRLQPIVQLMKNMMENYQNDV